MNQRFVREKKRTSRDTYGDPELLFSDLERQLCIARTVGLPTPPKEIVDSHYLGPPFKSMIKSGQRTLSSAW